MRRVMVLAALSLGVPALLAPAVLAQGSRYGSGRTPRQTVSDDELIRGFNDVLVLLVAVALLIVFAIVVIRRSGRRRARSDRARLVRAAAAEAARDDPAFAPAAVEAAAAALYVELQRAWSERDDEALRRNLGPELLTDWRRRLKAFEQRGVSSERTILEGPDIEYVGLINREGTDEDRVTVTIRAVLNSVLHPASGPSTHRELASSDGEIGISECWTLARDGDGWRVLSVEDEAPGAQHVDEPILARPGSDEATV